MRSSATAIRSTPLLSTRSAFTPSTTRLRPRARTELLSFGTRTQNPESRPFLGSRLAARSPVAASQPTVPCSRTHRATIGPRCPPHCTAALPHWHCLRRIDFYRRNSPPLPCTCSPRIARACADCCTALLAFHRVPIRNLRNRRATVCGSTGRFSVTPGLTNASRNE